MHTIKNSDTSSPTYKAHFVAGGNIDTEKDLLIHNSTTVRPVSVRIFSQSSAKKGWRICTDDINQYFIQIRGCLSRTVYLHRPIQPVLPSNSMLRLIKPLYILADSGDHWFATIRDNLTDDLAMTPSLSDPAFFSIENKEGTFVGLTGTYVDDPIHNGAPFFHELSQNTSELFECKPTQFDVFTFAGVQFTAAYGNTFMRKTRAIENQALLSLYVDYRSFKSRIMDLGG